MGKERWKEYEVTKVLNRRGNNIDTRDICSNSPQLDSFPRFD